MTNFMVDCAAAALKEAGCNRGLDVRRRYAAAVIEAIRYPTEPMLQAMDRRAGIPGLPVLHLWHDAIDEALKETP